MSTEVIKTTVSVMTNNFNDKHIRTKTQQIQQR